MARPRIRLCAWLAVAILCCAAPAHADQATEQPVEDDAVVHARQEYEEGIRHVKAHEWGKALESFERSAALHPHAVTTYNIGACHRAMGRYTRARAAFMSALERHRRYDELPPNLVADSERYAKEIDGLLTTLRLSIEPPDARVAIDGAPLAPLSPTSKTLVAGIRESGAGERIGAQEVQVLLDPGAHVLLLSRKGFKDVALNKTFAPGSKPRLALKLDLLPAQLRITADVKDAMVQLDGRTVGLAPIDLQQHAGSYQVTVQAPGHEPYETTVAMQPGEETTLRATLPERSPSIVERWWFWTAAGVVVTGAVIGTYFGTRPKPKRPGLNGGGLGWTVPLE